MKSINKKIITITLSVFFILFCVSCTKKEVKIPYDFSSFNAKISSSNGSVLNSFQNYFATDLCVFDGNDISSDEVNMTLAEGAALFDIENSEVIYAKNVHQKLYPASTTKILTTLVALEKGNLSDTVEITADCLDLESGASVCNFKVGDTPTLEQVLNGFMICSGNDAGVAIANHISGSVEAFAELMNEKANSLGATNSHFINPHGLHDEDHYSTVYDLYLIFNEAIKNDTFKKIISKSSYTASFLNKTGEIRELTWNTTNRYFRGTATEPENITILGSKTGTTNEAGACLVLFSKNTEYDRPYISIILKSTDAGTLYVEMNDLLRLIN